MHTICKSLAAVTLAAALAPAMAAELYGTQFSASTPLYLMDQATGAAVAGPNTGTAGVGDLASSGTDASVWAVVISTNTLVRFDSTTSTVAATVPITGSQSAAGAPENIVSLAWDTQLNLLYGSTASGFGGFNNLFRINPNTGAATLIGNMQIANMYALAYNPADGFLYGADGDVGEASSLWKIDVSNAVATLVGRLTTTGNFDIAFRPGDNKLFLASTGSSSLYTVDPLTAAETLVGPYGNPLNIAGLAFTATVPEPQTWALVLGPLLFLARRAKATRPLSGQ